MIQHHEGTVLDEPAADFPAMLLTPKVAAKSLMISERKLWELTNRGEIPCMRIGRSVRYRPADLQAWIDNHIEG
jgi:excisionase family DNA binding protein